MNNGYTIIRMQEHQKDLLVDNRKRRITYDFFYFIYVPMKFKLNLNYKGATIVLRS